MIAVYVSSIDPYFIFTSFYGFPLEGFNVFLDRKTLTFSLTISQKKGHCFWSSYAMPGTFYFSKMINFNSHFYFKV